MPAITRGLARRGLRRSRRDGNVPATRAISGSRAIVAPMPGRIEVLVKPMRACWRGSLSGRRSDEDGKRGARRAAERSPRSASARVPRSSECGISGTRVMLRKARDLVARTRSRVTRAVPLRRVGWLLGLAGALLALISFWLSRPLIGAVLLPLATPRRLGPARVPRSISSRAAARSPRRRAGTGGARRG